MEQHPVDEIIAPLVCANNLNNELFNLYLQTILLALLAFGTVIVMDNARYQRGVAPPLSEETKKLIEKMGSKLILLPPDGVLLHPFARFK